MKVKIVCFISLTLSLIIFSCNNESPTSNEFSDTFAVYISNTTNMNTESTGLIKSIILDGTDIIGLELYSEIEIPDNAQIIIRSLDYTNETPVVYVYEVTNKGLTNIVNISPILYNGNIRGAGEITGVKDKWYYDGDLFSLGQSEIYDCTITNIQYNEDNTATITARDY